jgi:hypothetical protein
MTTVVQQLVTWVMPLVVAVLVFLGALFAPAGLRARLWKARWWLLGLAGLVVAWAFLFYLPRVRDPGEFDSVVPPQFIPHYWTWMLAFLAGAVGAGLAAWGQLRAGRRSAGSSGAEAGFPDIDEAWDEILLRLGQAKIDPAGQRYYLLIAPDEPAVASLVEAAGLQVFAEGPGAPGPLRAWATSDGVLLSCAGACNLGEPGSPAASARLEHVARLLLALRPDCSAVRGVAILLPMGWCARPESVKEAGAVRDDLQVVRRVLGVQPPTFAILTGMEEVPGLVEFAGRLASQVSPQMLDQRVGFAVPVDQPFSGDLVQRGLTWQSGWFHNWILNLLAGDPTNHAGNADLVILDSEFRRYRRRLRAVLEAALLTHQEDEPVLFRGCYFVATGPGRVERAFAAGLLRGGRSRFIADHVASDWTDEADRADRAYGRIALVIALVGGLTCLTIWLRVIIPSLETIGWVGLGVLGVAWVLAGLRWFRR